MTTFIKCRRLTALFSWPGGKKAPLAAKASIKLKVRYPSRILPSSQQQWLSPLFARQQHNRRQQGNKDGDTAWTWLGSVTQSQSSKPIWVGFRVCVILSAGGVIRQKRVQSSPDNKQAPLIPSALASLAAASSLSGFPLIHRFQQHNLRGGKYRPTGPLHSPWLEPGKQTTSKSFRRSTAAGPIVKALMPFCHFYCPT